MSAIKCTYEDSTWKWQDNVPRYTCTIHGAQVEFFSSDRGGPLKEKTNLKLVGTHKRRQASSFFTTALMTNNDVKVMVFNCCLLYKVPSKFINRAKFSYLNALSIAEFPQYPRKI